MYNIYCYIYIIINYKFLHITIYIYIIIYIVSHQIVKMHDGTLTVYSDGEGHGCTFTLQLPRSSSLTPSSTKEEDFRTKKKKTQEMAWPITKMETNICPERESPHVFCTISSNIGP